MDNLSTAIYPPFLTRAFSGFRGVYPASFPLLPGGGEMLRNQVATSPGIGWRLASEYAKDGEKWEKTGTGLKDLLEKLKDKE